jgi:hypothetical protein
MGISDENLDKQEFQFSPPDNRDAADSPQTLCQSDRSASDTCSENSVHMQSCSIADPAVNGSGQKMEASDAVGILYTSDDSGFVDCPLTPAATASQPETDAHRTAANADAALSCDAETEKPKQRATLRQLLNLNLNLGGFRKKSSSSSSLSSPTVKRTASTPAFMTPVESPSEISIADDVFQTSPWSNGGAFSTPTYAKMRHFAQSPIQQPFARVATAVARNPYMSPLLAGDDLLADMCPVYLVVCLFSLFMFLLMSVYFVNVGFIGFLPTSNL